MITGEVGRLHWGYHLAAFVRAWTVTRTEGQWTLSATVESSDDYRLAQRPLVFVTPNGWRWPILTLQITGAALHGTLGPKEGSHGTVRQTAGRSPTA